MLAAVERSPHQIDVEYLYEMLCTGAKNYNRFLYLPMGVEPEGREQTARDRAKEKGWDFKILPGDMRLIDQLLNGDWNEGEFLTVSPGGTIKAAYDDSIVRAD